MIQKKIKINGKDVGVAYCFATEIAFKDYAGHEIQEFDTSSLQESIYLILAAAVAYANGTGEGDTPITDADLLYYTGHEELIEAVTQIFHMRNEWYHVPDGLAPKKEKKKSKNA